MLDLIFKHNFLGHFTLIYIKFAAVEIFTQHEPTCTNLELTTDNIRPRNINWQDWKYASFVVFVCYSKNIRRHHATNLLRTSSKTLDWNSTFTSHYIDFIIKQIQYIHASLFFNLMSCIDLYLIEKVYPVKFFSIFIA